MWVPDIWSRRKRRSASSNAAASLKVPKSSLARSSQGGGGAPSGKKLPCASHGKPLNNCQISIRKKKTGQFTINQRVVSDLFFGGLYRILRVMLMFWVNRNIIVTQKKNISWNIVVVHRWLMCREMWICLRCTMHSDMVFKATLICKLTTA